MIRPIGEEERNEMFNKLNSEIEEIELEYLTDPSARVYPCLLSYGKTVSLDKTKLNEWVDTYLKVIKDCELDTERAIQRLSKARIMRASKLNNFNHSLNRDENSIFMKNEPKKTTLNKSYSFLKVKKELNLKSAEDILGMFGTTLFNSKLRLITRNFINNPRLDKFPGIRFSYSVMILLNNFYRMGWI